MDNAPSVLNFERVQCSISLKLDNESMKNQPANAVVRAEILSKDFFQTLRKYYLSFTLAKIQRLKKNFTVKRFVTF